MKALIVGDLQEHLAPLAQALRAARAQVLVSADVASAIAVLAEAAQIDCVICALPLDHAQLISALRAKALAVPVLVAGRTIPAAVAVAAIQAGCRDVLELPVDAAAIAGLLAALSGDRRTVPLKNRTMQQLTAQARHVAASDASVLITGESGTGKEIFARHIHRDSRRSQGAFVAVNCAALPEHLLESELFGYEKGAFSGATARRIGKFEAASGGTLLLDEIGEIDFRLQAKLLRALQEREIDRLGGTAPVKVDVRIIATTNRDLHAEVKRGTFREDLYFRLNVVSFTLPPLRARRDDIEALAEHFARKFSEINAVPWRPFSEQARAGMARRDWPGNIRELENAIHRSVLMSTGPCLELEYDPGSGSAHPGATTPPPSQTIRSERGESGRVGMRLDEVERNLILDTLSHTHGNRTHAANLLGISIRSLRNKIRDYTSQGLPVTHPQNSNAA